MVSVACNGAHSLKERLARWLLMMRDRSDDDALPVTQNLLAEMLGVQRPTITNAAEELESDQTARRYRRRKNEGRLTNEAALLSRSPSMRTFLIRFQETRSSARATKPTNFVQDPRFFNAGLSELNHGEHSQQNRLIA